jgi:hypothetical protein
MLQPSELRRPTILDRLRDEGRDAVVTVRAVDRLLATLLTASLAAGLLALVMLGSDLPRILSQVWSVLSAASALVAVTTAFHGYLEPPVLLAMAITVAVAGRHAGHIVYCVTMFTVTAAVLVGGTSAGFLAGHTAATICWIAMAAALFIYARRSSGQRRAIAVTGGLALTAAATAKLFLFDLGTLDGIFRVTAFIVVGLVLLGMGTGYARSLAQHDRTLTH